MKYIIVGDFHGRSIADLVEIMRENVPVLEFNPRSRAVEDWRIPQMEETGFDALLSTGDFDQPSILEQFWNLEERLESQGVDVGKVAGNHDHAVYRGTHISSGTLAQQGKSIPELHSELGGEVENYLGHLLENTRQELRIGPFDTLLIHGGLEGDLSSYPECPPNQQDFWQRLPDEASHRKNFQAMEGRYGLMIRGHDHSPEYAFRENGNIRIEEPSPGDRFVLEDNNLHTVTHGAWFDGWYATIDTASHPPVLQYRKVDF